MPERFPPIEVPENIVGRRTGGAFVVGLLFGAGLFFVPVEHEGNVNSSSEEADRVAAIVPSCPAINWVRRTVVSVANSSPTIANFPAYLKRSRIAKAGASSVFMMFPWSRETPSVPRGFWRSRPGLNPPRTGRGRCREDERFLE